MQEDDKEDKEDKEDKKKDSPISEKAIIDKYCEELKKSVNNFNQQIAKKQQQLEALSPEAKAQAKLKEQSDLQKQKQKNEEKLTELKKQLQAIQEKLDSGSKESQTPDDAKEILKQKASLEKRINQASDQIVKKQQQLEDINKPENKDQQDKTQKRFEKLKDDIAELQKKRTDIQKKLTEIEGDPQSFLKAEQQKERAQFFKQLLGVEDYQTQIDEKKAELKNIEGNPAFKILQKGLEEKIEQLTDKQKSQQLMKDRLQKFLVDTQQEALGKRLFGEDFKVAAASIFDDKAIQEAFIRINGDYLYFDDDPKASVLFQHFYKICYYYWTVIENNANPSQVYDYAYKLMALFLESKDDNLIEKTLYENLDNFIKEFCGNIDKPIHDLLADIQFPELTEDSPFEKHFAEWQTFIRENNNT